MSQFMSHVTSVCVLMLNDGESPPSLLMDEHQNTEKHLKHFQLKLDMFQ